MRQKPTIELQQFTQKYNLIQPETQDSWNLSSAKIQLA